MAKRLRIAPVSQQYKLDLFDPSGEEYVVVRQARKGDDIALENLFAEQTQVFNDVEVGTFEIKRSWNSEELQRERIYRTLIGCSLMTTDEEGGNPVFTFSVDRNGEPAPGPRTSFDAAYAALPVELADEIYAKVIKHNPQFGGRGE